MRHIELSNFTYEELHNFINADLTLDKYELIAKAENRSISLPKDVQEKLQSLCTELAKQSPAQKHLFENFSVHTVNDFLSFIINLSKIHHIFSDPSLCDSLRDIVNEICTFLSQH